MLHYVRAQCIGKPFSNYAMVRSLVWPRETDHTSFFCAGALASAPAQASTPPPPPPPCSWRHHRPAACACAELVASVLKVGGLLDANCNPGAATPEMLHRIYAPRGAVSANPCLLREINGGIGAAANSSAGGANGFIGNLSAGERLAEREALLPAYMRQNAAGLAFSAPLPAAPQQPIFHPARRRADSPPRGHFHAVNRDHAPLGAVRGGAAGSACSARCVTTGGIQLTMDSLKMGGGGGRCKVHPR